MSPSRRPLQRLTDVIENIDRVTAYVVAFPKEDFVRDLKTQDAVERCLLRLSEAAIKLGVFAEDALPHHDWAGIRGIGNVLRHEYDFVNPEIIWRVVVDDLPRLRIDVARLLKSFPSD